MTLSEAKKLFLSDFISRQDQDGIIALFEKTQAQQKADLKAFLLVKRDYFNAAAAQTTITNDNLIATALEYETFANTL